MALGGSEGMLPQKIFEHLDDVMAILVFFKQFLRQFCSIFLPLTLSPSPNMQHFVRTFSIYACLRSKDHCYQKYSTFWKICSH